MYSPLTPRSLRRALTAGAIATLAVAIAMLLWGGWMPLQDATVPPNSPSSPSLEPAEISPLPPLVAFEECWAKPMQGPPAIPESVPTSNENSPSPSAVQRPDIVLLGTYDARIAVFRVAGGAGEEVVVGVGDQVGSALVKEIAPRCVRLLVDGTVFTYELDGP